MGRRAVYYAKKALLFLLSVLLLSVAVFYAARLAPGDPLTAWYGDRAEKMTPEERFQVEGRLGLHDPIHVQYLRWLSGAARGEFGISYRYKTDVAEVIRGRLGGTLLLGGAGFVLIFTLAPLLGLLCARYEGRWPDRVLCRVGTVTSCIPEFWLSLVLILVFSVTLQLLPSGGAYTVGRAHDLGDRLAHLILPLTVVVAGHLWYYAYLVRNLLLDEVRSDYVLLARMKGLSRRRVLLRHCLRGVLPAYLSLMAISVPHILGGTYVVETVFAYPGLGALAYESARYQDYNLLMLLCMLTGALVILCATAAQIISERLDPRLRRDRARSGKGAASHAP